MDTQSSSTQSLSRSVNAAGNRKPGRHARPATLPTRPVPDMTRERSLERISAADQALADAHARLRNVGKDSALVNAAFTIARESLRDAQEVVRDARREVAMMTYEIDQERRANRIPAQAVAPVVPDSPGLDLCPDPTAARTAADFMDVLRRYRVWAGKPSYRTMRDQCGRRFATSTIHAALSAADLPGLPMVHAIVAACGGTDSHQQAFASAWRRLAMAAPDGRAGEHGRLH
jgi:hypothetical protein